MIIVLSRALPLKTHQSVYLLALDNDCSLILARDMRMGETRACVRDLDDIEMRGECHVQCSD